MGKKRDIKRLKSRRIVVVFDMPQWYEDEEVMLFVASAVEEHTPFKVRAVQYNRKKEEVETADE